MPKYIKISPLPPSTSTVKVREIFSPFIYQKMIFKDQDQAAYLKFADASEVEGLLLKYENYTIPELGGAQIIQLPEQFQPKSIQGLGTQPKPQMKEVKVQSINMNEKKQQNSKPTFLVIKDCDLKTVDSITEQTIKKRIFNNYKIGRVLKFRNQVYVQFLDANQVEMLEISFPDGMVRQLGSSATIDQAGPNFHYQQTKSQKQKYEQQKLLAQAQQLQRIKNQKSSIQQTMQKMQKQLQSLKFKQYSNWSVRPDAQREMERVKMNTFNLWDVGKENRPVFWAAVVLLWGLYVMFM